MRTGRFFAVVAAAVLTVWPLAMTTAWTGGQRSHHAEIDDAPAHCNPEDSPAPGEGEPCPYFALCAQLCTGLLPTGGGGLDSAIRIARLYAAPVRAPDAKTFAPPEPPPRNGATA